MNIAELFKKNFPKSSSFYGVDYMQTSPTSYILDKVFQVPYEINKIYIDKILKICINQFHGNSCQIKGGSQGVEISQYEFYVKNIKSPRAAAAVGLCYRWMVESLRSTRRFCTSSADPISVYRSLGYAT